MRKILLIFVYFSCWSLFAQENITFQKPSQEILQLADYSRPPVVTLSPDKLWTLLSYRPTYKTIEELGQEEVRLAGIRINPRTHLLSNVIHFNELRVKSNLTGEEFELTGIPSNSLISNVSFSPDSKKIAFTITNGSGLSLWMFDFGTKTAKQLTDYNLNAVLRTPYVWAKEGKGFLISTVATSSIDLENVFSESPTGPIISTSQGQVAQLRTYQDLLKNPHDENVFENLATSSLSWLDLAGNMTSLLPAGMYTQVSLSPDEKYVLVTELRKPFSYVVGYRSFPQVSSVYDVEGNVIQVVNNRPLLEGGAKGFSSTIPGKRLLSWRLDKPSTLWFVEAKDDGDANIAVEYRDELFTLDYPYNSEPKLIARIKDRFSKVIWGNDEYALVSSDWYDTRKSKVFLLNPTTGKMQQIVDRNSQDVYSDPGNVFLERNKYGRKTIYIDKNKMYWIRPGYTTKGEFPYIDILDLKTLKTKIEYISKESDMQERVLDIVDLKKGEILISLESANTFPNYFFKNNKTGKLQPITSIQNPFSPLELVHKEILQYKRKDGVDLFGTLYLPEGYDKGGDEKLPLLIWAYPREYKDKATASQSTANAKQFTFPNYGSFVYWVNKGYAVLDNASFPIVGEDNQEPNDTFIPQLVANAEAAIDAVAKLGYIDRKKVAIGGHSYGAFMTAHLLSNSDLFAAGIARSGAYNRTLTPFGFQSEQRNLWDDPALYMKMSPFMSADRMKTPLLLVHGAADNNPGTFTMQTERYFQALKNLGAPVRMVILPRESHSYVAKENVFHLLWEQDQFLEKHLKNKKN